MKTLSMDVYKEFKCIASDCPSTCCGGWGIRIDKNTLDYYEKLEGEDGEWIRNGLTKISGGYTSFKYNENNRCVFLDDKQLCSVYQRLGEKNV